MNLQIEITKYFCRYLDNFEQGFTDTIGLYVSNTTGERTPVLPTLFGSTKMKSHIVSLVSMVLSASYTCKIYERHHN